MAFGFIEVERWNRQQKLWQKTLLNTSSVESVLPLEFELGGRVRSGIPEGDPVVACVLTRVGRQTTDDLLLVKLSWEEANVAFLRPFGS